MSINTAVMRAVLALKYLKTGKTPSNGETDSLMSNIRKINSILMKILDPETLRKIICLAKKDPSFKPKIATYSANSIKRLRLMRRFWSRTNLTQRPTGVR